METIDIKTNTKIKNAYGIYLTIPNNYFQDFRKQVIDAENVTDVMVDVGGIKKEFTGKEFLKKLGFEQ